MLLLLFLMLAGCAATPPWVVSDFDGDRVELTREPRHEWDDWDLNGIQLHEAANRICKKYGAVADFEVGAMREECVSASARTYCSRTYCSSSESCVRWRQVAVIACLRE